MKRIYLLLSILTVLSGLAMYNQATAGSISGIIPHKHSANYNGGKVEFLNLSGILNPSKISPQGIGSGLNADMVDGYNTSMDDIGSTIPVRNSFGGIYANASTGFLLGNSSYSLAKLHFDDMLTNSITLSSGNWDWTIKSNDGNRKISLGPLDPRLVVYNNKVDVLTNLNVSGAVTLSSGLNSSYLTGYIANARFGNISSQKLTPQGTGSGLNADTVDALDSTTLLARANHTGTQAPATISPQGIGSGLNADSVDGLHSGSFQKLRGGGCQTYLDIPANTSQTGTEQSFTTANTDIFNSNIMPSNNTLNASICTVFLTNNGDYVVITGGQGTLPTCPTPSTYNTAVTTIRNNNTVAQSLRYCSYAHYY